ncbi:hypothetical protein FRC08_014922 [Ceratobasidium sp. 394]|nr:hypothetical protein FRC08_014922 [Ceratobasidium sp. 394]
MSLPPWDQQTFSFGWEPYVHTIKQCSKLNIQFSNDLGLPSLHANPPPAPPYTVIVYQGGFAPLNLAVGNMGQTGTYPWVVNLPLGPSYMLAMKDSAGYTGGVSLLWTMTAGTGCTLTPSPMPPSKLNFTRTGNSQCGNVNIEVYNGTSPYQVEIIPEVRQQKTLHFATNEFGFVLDLPAGLNFFLAITDADGNSAVDGTLSVGTSSDNSCLNAAATMTVGMFTSVFSGSGVVMPSSSAISPSTATSQASSTTSAGTGGQQSSNSTTGSGSSIGGIVGGVVSGVVAIAALALFLCWFLRRRRRRERDAMAANRQRGEGPKPETGYANPNMPGYSIPYNTQYPYAAVPQIQEHDPRDNANVVQPFMMPAAGATRQSYDSYSHPPVKHSAITVHAPAARPLSDQSVQSITYYGAQSSDQYSPASNRFSQTTGTTAPILMSNDTRNSTENRSAGLPWNPDRKERVASPQLPPGAMPPSSPTGSSIHPWSKTMSPPPRSLTGTALPPYESGSQYQGSIRE